MGRSIHDYSARSSDWRASLRLNQRRTRFVIGIFLAIYVFLGLLIDLYLYSNHNPGVPLSSIFFALISFQVVPYATLVTAAIAIISLLVTFAFHDKLMLLGSEYRQITHETAKSFKERQLYNVIEEMKVASRLGYLPKIFVIEADYMNAFASGYSEKSAMVAITRGLMEKLDRDELQAVMAHELSHIRHMDIRLTLMASVLANIMLIIVDVLFYSFLFSRSRRSSEGEGGAGWLMIIVFLLRALLPLITFFLILFLSRTREYMADAGCVELMRNNEPLARALLKIEADHRQHQETYKQAYDNTPHESVRREAYIFDPLKAGIESRHSLTDFFSTHPSIKKRLEAIGFSKKS